MFFVKHAINQLHAVQPSPMIRGQLLSVLATVLPEIKGIYGEFWADILGEIEKAGKLNSDGSLFGIYATLRLLSLLRRSNMQEANDDLLDAWNEKKAACSATLVELMTQLASEFSEYILCLWSYLDD